MAGGPYNGQLSQAIQFSSTGSFDPDGTIVSYHWNFGDGTSANSANPTHTYSAPSLYTATLTVTDNAGLLASATASVNIQGSSNARLDPRNQTGGGGENPLSRNFNWSLPLVGLPGRAGLDLGLMLSYNSLVWTKNGNFISFDDDNGFPSAGFRLGFPVIQPLYYNQEVSKYAYLLIGSDGSRTELRQVGTSALFEASDSSHLLLDTSLTLPAPDNGEFVLWTTDGTKMWYEWLGSEFQCTQIKDRNGNFITVNYLNGRISTIIDTLNREIKFEYVEGRLDKITQVWKQGTNDQRTHVGVVRLQRCHLQHDFH
jgi:PKD repeat protein